MITKFHTKFNLAKSVLFKKLIPPIFNFKQVKNFKLPKNVTIDKIHFSSRWILLKAVVIAESNEDIFHKKYKLMCNDCFVKQAVRNTNGNTIMATLKYLVIII